MQISVRKVNRCTVTVPGSDLQAKPSGIPVSLGEIRTKSTIGPPVPLIWALMIYRILHPVPALSDIVEYYWYAKIDLTQSVEQFYATPLLEGLAFNFNKRAERHSYHDRVHTLDKTAYLFGQPTTPRVVATDEKGIDIIGVKFKPLGIPRLTGIKMQYIADAILPLEDIWPRDIESLCDAMQSASSFEKALIILENFLLDQFNNTRLHYRADTAANAVRLMMRTRGNIHIKQLQFQTNTTRKTLERAFFEYIGLHPKLYTRILRFNAAKDIMDQEVARGTASSCCLSGTSLAIDHGFYDSSHFSAEFKRFAGCTPQAYLKNTPLQLVFKDN